VENKIYFDEPPRHGGTKSYGYLGTADYADFADFCNFRVGDFLSTGDA
jgi:hypothetical protein